ncbi:MAG: RnfABCDGE type electron transport complex subunit B [Lachnospiraceae bacterium]
MNMTGIIIAGALIAGVGIFIGVFLGIAGEKFEVEVDPREAAIAELLPQSNCGGCGYPGCSGLAAAIVKGEAPVNQCTGCNAEVVKKIGEIMGVEAEAKEPQVAFVRCKGTCDKAKSDYIYSGITDCSMAKRVPGGGAKSCSYGCLGLGSCVKACPFDAIHVVQGVAVVDKEKCKACGKCIAACPNGLIEFVPKTSVHLVQCNNKDMGKQVMQVCQSGCIACHICEKNCPAEAITVTDNVAHIDQSKCTHCGICAEKCPKKVIS